MAEEFPQQDIAAHPALPPDQTPAQPPAPPQGESSPQRQDAASLLGTAESQHFTLPAVEPGRWLGEEKQQRRAKLQPGRAFGAAPGARAEDAVSENGAPVMEQDTNLQPLGAGAASVLTAFHKP